MDLEKGHTVQSATEGVGTLLALFGVRWVTVTYTELMAVSVVLVKLYSSLGCRV